jgi:hypothetical protein
MQLSFSTKMKLGYDLQQVTCETKGSSIMKLSALTKMKLGYNCCDRLIFQDLSKKQKKL